MELLNCKASDALGYPAYYRATYERRAWESTAQLRLVIREDVLAPLASSGLVAPLNDESEILDGSRTAVVDLVTVPSVGAATVTDLARELEVGAWGGLYPLSAVTFKSLARLQSDGDVNLDERAAVVSSTADAPTPIEHAAHVVVVVVVILAIAWALSSIAKLKRG